MKLHEVGFELAKAQLQRRSAGGLVPRIVAVTFHPVDEAGQVFTCRAMFAYGPDLTCQIELDAPADLTDSDWEERLDAAVFNDECRWRQ